MGGFADAVTGLCADLAERRLTKGVMSSDQALRGYKAAMDAALGRGSQALTQWIEEDQMRRSATRLQTISRYLRPRTSKPTKP